MTIEVRDGRGIPVEHVNRGEREGFYCWCLPKVELVNETWIVIHHDPKAKGGES